MTPLAHRIAKEWTLPPRQRTFVDGGRIMPVVPFAKCFEVSGILDAVKNLLSVPPAEGQTGSAAVRDRVADIAQQTTFLPAPGTWVEWGSGAQRIGCLLADMGEHALVAVASADPAHGVFCSLDYTFTLGLGAHGTRTDQYRSSRSLTSAEERDVADLTATLNGALAFINAPHIIGRDDHPPHRGLTKKLAPVFGKDAEARMHPWTEIKLRVTPLEPTEGGQPGAISGQKALHFCRSHLRLRNGRLEIVRSHWRGNPALGVRQSTYRVVE